jgi:hypothetical protein
MDGAIHATTARERAVGGVDDGVYRQRCDVSVDDVDSPHTVTASAQHRGSAAKRDSMKKKPPWTPTYKISALRQLHPLVGRRRS